MNKILDKQSRLKEFAKRLNDRLDAIGYPAKKFGRQTKLAQDLKADQKAVRRWLEGLGYPSDDNLRTLAEFVGVNPSTLKYGGAKNELLETATINDSGIVLISSQTEAEKSVPLLDISEIGRSVRDTNKLKQWPAAPVEKLDSGISKVEGTSMSSGTQTGYPHGTYIYWTKAGSASVGDHVIAELKNGDTVFRELDLDGSKRMLRPLNTQYPIITDPFKIIAIVTGRYQSVSSSLS